jgi:hypothetical protein
MEIQPSLPLDLFAADLQRPDGPIKELGDDPVPADKGHVIPQSSGPNPRVFDPEARTGGRNSFAF